MPRKRALRGPTVSVLINLSSVYRYLFVFPEKETVTGGDDCRVNGFSTVVLIGFTCPAITVVDRYIKGSTRVRERALGCFARSPKSPPELCFVLFSVICDL